MTGRIARKKTFARTLVASKNPIFYGDGLAQSEFFPPGGTYFGRQVCPSDNMWAEGSRSFMAPISHFHVLRSESFEVESGSGIWFMKGKAIQLNAGDKITIPRCISHRFESVPDSTKPLVILYRYDWQKHTTEERLFRNVLTYFDDCRKHGVAPSLLQIAVFCAYGWMPADIIDCPGGDYVRCAVNLAFIWGLALVGLVAGYRVNYPEYYDPVLSKAVWSK